MRLDPQQLQDALQRAHADLALSISQIEWDGPVGTGRNGFVSVDLARRLLLLGYDLEHPDGLWDIEVPQPVPSGLMLEILQKFIQAFFEFLKTSFDQPPPAAFVRQIFGEMVEDLTAAGIVLISGQRNPDLAQMDLKSIRVGLTMPDESNAPLYGNN